MTEQTAAEHGWRLTRRELSDAVSPPGWRLVLAQFRTNVAVRSLAEAGAFTAAIASAIDASAAAHLRLDARPDRVIATIENLSLPWPSQAEIDLARQISAIAAELGLETLPDLGASSRSVQAVEIAIDALEIPKIRPFWKAVMGYVDEIGRTGPEDAIVDPHGQSPAIWFQQMDAPRPQRNRIHFDISVPHDEAEGRIAAALAAGGTLASDKAAPAFWVLADAEGNEACITTWQARD
jgi:4a-hydroxytetrahydrobiopterin dehydratase